MCLQLLKSFLHSWISLIQYQPNQIQGNKEIQKDNLIQIIVSAAHYLEVQKEQPKYFRSASK